MSAISGSVEQQPPQHEDNGRYKPTVIFHLLFASFSSNGRSSPSSSSDFVGSHRTKQQTVKRLQRRKRKCCAWRRQKKLKKRRRKNYKHITCTPSTFWSSFFNLYEQFSSLCHLYQRKSQCAKPSRLQMKGESHKAKHVVSTFRGETVPVKSKPLMDNPTKEDNASEDSGIASQASASTKKIDLPSKADPVADTKSTCSGGRHQATGEDGNRFPTTSVNGAQHIPSDSKQVTVTSQVTHAAHDIPHDSVQVTLSSHSPSTVSSVYIPPLFDEEIPLLHQHVKPFTCQLGKELSWWHDGLPPVNLTTRETGEIPGNQYQNEPEVDEGNVLVDGFYIAEQATQDENDGDHNELLAPSIPWHPSDRHEEAIPLPRPHIHDEPSPRPTEQTYRAESLRPTIEPFSWPPPGFCSCV